MKTYRLKASSIHNYEMLVKAENEDEACEYASLHSGKWKSIDTDDWQDDGCEEVKPQAIRPRTHRKVCFGLADRLE